MNLDQLKQLSIQAEAEYEANKAQSGAEGGDTISSLRNFAHAIEENNKPREVGLADQAARGVADFGNAATLGISGMMEQALAGAVGEVGDMFGNEENTKDFFGHMADYRERQRGVRDTMPAGVNLATELAGTAAGTAVAGPAAATRMAATKLPAWLGSGAARNVGIPAAEGALTNVTTQTGSGEAETLGDKGQAALIGGGGGALFHNLFRAAESGISLGRKMMTRDVAADAAKEPKAPASILGIPLPSMAGRGQTAAESGAQDAAKAFIKPSSSRRFSNLQDEPSGIEIALGMPKGSMPESEILRMIAQGSPDQTVAQVLRNQSTGADLTDATADLIAKLGPRKSNSELSQVIATRAEQLPQKVSDMVDSLIPSGGKPINEATIEREFENSFKMLNKEYDQFLKGKGSPGETMTFDPRSFKERIDSVLFDPAGSATPGRTEAGKAIKRAYQEALDASVPSQRGKNKQTMTLRAGHDFATALRNAYNDPANRAIRGEINDLRNMVKDQLRGVDSGYARLDNQFSTLTAAQDAYKVGTQFDKMTVDDLTEEVGRLTTPEEAAAMLRGMRTNMYNVTDSKAPNAARFVDYLSRPNMADKFKTLLPADEVDRVFGSLDTVKQQVSADTRLGKGVEAANRGTFSEPSDEAEVLKNAIDAVQVIIPRSTLATSQVTSGRRLAGMGSKAANQTIADLLTAPAGQAGAQRFQSILDATGPKAGNFDSLPDAVKGALISDSLIRDGILGGTQQRQPPHQEEGKPTIPHITVRPRQ